MIDSRLVDALFAECAHKLAAVCAAQDAERQKPFGARKPSYLVFLDKEHAVYSFGMEILQKLRTPIEVGVAAGGAEPRRMP